MPLELHPSFMFFDAHVNGKAAPAFLDSESSITIISKKISDQLGLNTKKSKSTEIENLFGKGRSLGVVKARLTIGTDITDIHVVSEPIPELLVGVHEALRYGLTADFIRGNVLQNSQVLRGGGRVTRLVPPSCPSV